MDYALIGYIENDEMRPNLEILYYFDNEPSVNKVKEKIREYTNGGYSGVEYVHIIKKR